jgi:predicted branched-subunit amino acid permease
MAMNNSFKKGLRDGLPICFGYLSVSFAFGIFAVGSGLSVLEAILISMFNLTSAGQLAAVPIIAAGGGFLELISTQLIINLRYALMSVSLSQKMDSSVRVRDRLVVSFANTDEVFAVASSNVGEVGRRYMYGLIITPFLGWTLGTALGALAGNVLPASVVSALGIAIYAMFIAIVVPVARVNIGVALCALLAIAISAIFYYLPALSEVPSGFVIIIAAIVSAALFAILRPIEEKEDVQDA